MKNYKVLMIVNIILIIYILTLSVGYGLFSETLTINGVASTVEFYEGNNLPISPIIRDTKNNYFFTSSFDDSYLLSYKSESWKDDTYTLNIDKSLLLAYEGKDITYTISFSNPTVLNYTNGYISTEVIGDNSDIVSTSGTLSTTEVAPNENVDFSFTIRVDDFSDSDTSAKATITYMLQDETRYLNFIINYNAADYVNLFNQDLLLLNKNVTKTNEGYAFADYALAWTTNSINGTELINNIKSKLQSGVTYELIRDYQGTVNASNGMVSLINENNVLVLSAFGIGPKKVTFTLTQEEIDSLSRVYIYGAHDGTGIFKYIIIREAKQ